MAARLQSTRLQRNLSEWANRLEDWAENPWRRASLLAIVLMGGFFFGSSVASIAGATGQLDPIAALVTVALLELMVRLRRSWRPLSQGGLGLQCLDMGRFGLLYGLLLEGFKLL